MWCHSENIETDSDKKLAKTWSTDQSILNINTSILNIN